MPIFSKIRALMANGLTGVDLAWCWVAWRILPLSRRPGLMCEYTGDVKDPQRHCQIELDDDEINRMTKTLLNESLETCIKTGLNPFCTLKKAPAVSFLNNLQLILYLLKLSYHYHLTSCRLIPPFGTRNSRTTLPKRSGQRPRLPKSLPRIKQMQLIHLLWKMSRR